MNIEWNSKMPFTVKQISELSGISVRTIHYYDEIGLLKPAFIGHNGYRQYEQDQIVRLQTILFYRELGFELKKIKEILTNDSFNTIDALESHKRLLQSTIDKNKKLISTIDKTINHLKGDTKMKAWEMFEGFSKEEQANHEEYLVNRYGDSIKKSIKESHNKTKYWDKEKWLNTKQVFASICQQLVEHMKDNKTHDSECVQECIQEHYDWLCQFWTPDRESYSGYAQLVSDSDLRSAYESHDEQLPDFIALAITHFARTHL